MIESLESLPSDFVAAWNRLAEVHHERMMEKGFWNSEMRIRDLLCREGRADLAVVAQAAFDGQKIALHASELSEALEGLRLGNPPDDKIPQFMASEAELADVLLRIMDHAAMRGWRVAEALVAKMEMNAGRDKMHGKGF